MTSVQGRPPTTRTTHARCRDSPPQRERVRREAYLHGGGAGELQTQPRATETSTRGPSMAAAAPGAGWFRAVNARPSVRCDVRDPPRGRPGVDDPSNVPQARPPGSVVQSEHDARRVGDHPRVRQPAGAEGAPEPARVLAVDLDGRVCGGGAPPRPVAPRLVRPDPTVDDHGLPLDLHDHAEAVGIGVVGQQRAQRRPGGAASRRRCVSSRPNTR